MVSVFDETTGLSTLDQVTAGPRSVPASLLEVARQLTVN